MKLKLKEATLAHARGVLPLDRSRDTKDKWLKLTKHAMVDATCIPFTPDDEFKNSFVLQATFEMKGTPPASVTIAIEPVSSSGGGPVLAAPPTITIEKADWHKGKCQVTIPLDGTLLCPAVDFHRIQYCWRGPYDLQDISEHLLFVVLAAPAFPWATAAKPPRELAVPWPGVLAVACEWASGSTTVPDAVTRIALRLLALGDPTAQPGSTRTLKYAPDGSEFLGGGLARPLWFEWFDFLEDLHDITKADPIQLSCAETSSIVVTLANLLGCALHPLALHQVDIHRQCAVFQTVPAYFLGLEQPVAFPFQLHVTPAAVENPSNLAGALVYEPLFVVSGGANPSGWKPLMGMPLATFETAAFAVSANSWDVHCDEPTRVRKPKKQTEVSPCEFRRFEHYLRLLEPPPTPDKLPGTLLIANYSASQVPVVDSYPERRAGLPAVLPRWRTLYRQSESGERVLLVLDLWSSADRALTAQVLAEKLACIETPPETTEWLDGRKVFLLQHRVLWTLIPGAAIRLESRTPGISLLNILQESPPAPV